MKRVLVLSPHPDDEAVGCGGALCSHRAEGAVVRVVFLTSGERGGHGRAPAETARLREEEAQAAAHILGLEQVDFWRQPDGALRATRHLADQLRTLLSDWQPHVLYVTHEHEMHPDHRAAARLVRRALSGEPPLPARPNVLMYEVWTPLQRMDEIVDISACVEIKLAAVRAHQSQCAVLRFDEAVQGLNRYRGEMHSWPGGDYAEVFARMRL
jgi:LmbE family N-acetylglucosaminyl deacetylase